MDTCVACAQHLLCPVMIDDHDRRGHFQKLCDGEVPRAPTMTVCALWCGVNCGYAFLYEHMDTWSNQIMRDVTLKNKKGVKGEHLITKVRAVLLLGGVSETSDAVLGAFQCGSVGAVLLVNCLLVSIFDCISNCASCVGRFTDSRLAG